MHLGGYLYSRVELLTSKGAEKTTVASAADCEVEADSLTAGHERKHNACRAELEVALVVIPIPEEYTTVEQTDFIHMRSSSSACSVYCRVYDRSICYRRPTSDCVPHDTMHNHTAANARQRSLNVSPVWAC